MGGRTEMGLWGRMRRLEFGLGWVCDFGEGWMMDDIGDRGRKFEG
jgi:hypothetical protein